MIKILKRVSDSKYLKSVENDLWVDSVSEAFEMSYLECEDAKAALSSTYGEGSLKELVNMVKFKPVSREEAKELRNILKNI